MRKVFSIVIAIFIAALSFVFFAPAANAGTDKIGICHATGNGKYVSIEISKDGTASGHAGSDHQNGEDIIPAYSWVENKTRYYFDGQNLDKSAYLLNGCASPVETIVLNPTPPTYIPASCANPEFPYGQVVVPNGPHPGVTGISDPYLNVDNTVWSVSYMKELDTNEFVYLWNEGFNGTFNFNVVPITEDEFWVVDSKTGEGSCVLPETGAADYIPWISGGLLMLALGVVATRATRRTV
jgi:hypothetical protein